MKIKFNEKEVEKLVADYVIETFGIDTTGKGVDVRSISYDGVEVSITEAEETKPPVAKGRIRRGTIS